MGIFGGSGVGKSTLLGAMARHNSADVTVIALIGERNREVRAFLEHELGPRGQQALGGRLLHFRPARSSARPRLLCGARDRRVFSRPGRQCAVDHGFGYAPRHGAARDRARRRRTAQPERLHALGVQPAAEDSGARRQFSQRSITGFFTVLVEGDDFNEPICDAVRSILDGHIILSRHLAASGHYPAIDILHSVSRFPQARRSRPSRSREYVTLRSCGL